MFRNLVLTGWVVVLTSAGPWLCGQAAASPPVAAAKSELLPPVDKTAGAFAHDPKFSDRAVWPEWVEKTDFIKQDWPKARLLTWAKTEIVRNPDLNDPANWLEDGKPAKTAPDENTDVVFPAGPKSYSINGEGSCTMRHVTVEPGVRIGLKTFVIHGNVWVKKGAIFSQVSLRGTRNTFMRSDAAEANQAANKINFNRDPGTSVEWIGTWKLGDELDLFSGDFIVSPGSTFLPGDRSSQRIYPKARLILLSGSTFQKRGTQYCMHDLQITGELLAGTPQRPLTADCTIGLSAKIKGAGDARLSKAGDRGLVLYKEGKITVNSTDPAKARLVLKLNPLPASSMNLTDEQKPLLPKGIDMILLGEANLQGVEFNDVLKGGILMPDVATAAKWKNVTLGTGNGGTLQELLAPYKGAADIKMDNAGIAGQKMKKAGGDE
jgi:hypothetical protein